MPAGPGPEWSAEYSRGWDDCLEAIHKVLGERFPRRVSLLMPAEKAYAPDASTKEGREKIAANAKHYRDTLKPFA